MSDTEKGGKKDLSTQWSEENQPKKRTPRGRDKSALIWEAMGRRMEEKKKEDPDSYKVGVTAEREFYDEWVSKAFKGLNQGENFLFGELIKRLHPQSKATNDPVEFAFPEDGTPIQKFDAVMVAISTGVIPPDIGTMLVQVINTGVNIQDVTDLAKRVEEIETAMKADA